MKFGHYLSASILVLAAHSASGEVINIPQSALLPPGDPGQVSWIAGDAGLNGTTSLKLIAEITGTAVANSLSLDVQNNGFPAPPIGGATDDVIVFGPGAVPGAVATVDIPATCGIALFHDVFDETGVFLSGPNGNLDDSGPDARDAYMSSESTVSYTVQGRRQLVKYFPAFTAHSYKFSSQWNTVTQLGSGFRAFIFLDDDHTPNFDYDDLIVGVVAPPCVNNADCSDGDICTGEETCVDGVCHDGQWMVCDDGAFCNGVEVCVNGVCQAGSPPTCSDGIACTTDSCSANHCVHEAVNASCPSDGIFCNGTESCDVAFGCVSSGNPCEVGEICDEEDGLCRTCQNNSDCDDGNPCTIGHACNNGICVPGEPVDCSGAGTQCKIASCSPVGEAGNCNVLTSVQNGVGCNDGLYCTVQDVCLAGVCGGTARDCSTLNDQCNTGVCNETSDSCQAQPISGETVCNDGDECTDGDACENGICQGLHLYGLPQWESLEDCLAGPEITSPPACICSDLDNDGDVDLQDTGAFQNLMSAP